MASNPLQNPSLPSLPQHQQNDTGLTSALAHQAAEDLSLRAYTRLGHRSEDQAIVFL